MTVRGSSISTARAAQIVVKVEIQKATARPMAVLEKWVRASRH